MAPKLLDRAILVENSHQTPGIQSLKSFAARAVAVTPYVLALVATGLFMWLFLRVQSRVGDEGSIVYNAARVTEGAVPYRDFFEVMGSGTFYWLALWFKAFGATWLTSRIALLVTALVSIAAIYYVAVRQYRGKLAAVPAVLYALTTVPSFPGVSHHFDSNMWALLAFAVSVSAVHFNRKTSISIGVLAGLASTSMPQKGVLVLAGICMARLLHAVSSREWRRAFADTLWMVGSLVLVGTSVGIFFWSRGALSELVYANVIWPATQYHSVNVLPYAYYLRELAFDRFAPLCAALLPSPISDVCSVLAASPFILIAVLPFVAAMLMFHAAVARKRPAAAATVVPWCYWFAGFGLFVSEFHRVDLIHLAYGSPILLVAVIVWLGRANGTLAGPIRATLVCCVAMLAALLTLIGIGPATVTTKTRSGDIQLVRQDDALNFLHQNVAAGEQVFVYPYYPMYYFLANVRNPTRYSILMYHINTPAQFEEVTRDLEAAQVKYILWDTVVAGANLTQWFPGYQDPPANEQHLEQYFERHYRLIGIKNGFRVLQRM